MLQSVARTTRFAIPESHGGRETQIRLIGDFRAGGFNDVVAVPDTEIPQDLDVFLATAAPYQARCPKLPPHAFSGDYSIAYKNVPRCRDQHEFATIAFTPPEGSPQAARLRTQPCGPARAPDN